MLSQINLGFVLTNLLLLSAKINAAVACMQTQLGLLEDELHAATETAADADLDDNDDDAEEIDKILHTATTTGKLSYNRGGSSNRAFTCENYKLLYQLYGRRKAHCHVKRSNIYTEVERCS